MSTLILVDGPNLYNDIDRWFSARPDFEETLRHDYHLRWFDIDRVVQATINSGELGDYRTRGLGIVMFHSEKALGRAQSRLSGSELDLFWNRQAASNGASTVLVTVPGYQPDTMSAQCTCGKDVTVESRSEKGVDTSMVTYLYEAADHWDQAILFTNDADFVPPILALRRRGKRVHVAALDTSGNSALKRACQTFFPIKPRFLELDFAVFQFLQRGGKLDEAVRGIALRTGEYVGTDGGGCPMVVLAEEDEGRENKFADDVGARDMVRWITSNKGPHYPANRGREGRIFHNSGFALGEGMIRHRNDFQNALWFTHWRDD